ncbi:Phosphoglycerate mutase [Methanocorpusculum labreanum Z]|uniref:Phosphoglycerate mutase n=1 Tax=Methanocorpusculum labreanum (strain ATCC 43576 / DSM 4855 / Z) TaxID=410358 RepID=A2SU79_METLZ|nr:histidine phosphatase family protein [Methanocorpusculum labreanum]ABN07885.1 Phosphoglycerate mutase [Methanocorpusculum labreanum Z]
MDLPLPSSDGTYHEFGGAPIYEKRFKAVGPFRFPGLAAVVDESGAYHIDFSGSPLYEERYAQAGDFSYDCAVVKTADGEYFHINEEGKRIGHNNYLYAEEFFEGTAVIYRKNYGATHITTGGEMLYGDWYFDARRFVNGEALVRDEDGWLVIDMTGKEIHRADPPEDEYPISGMVRFIGTESPIPTILKMTEWDAAVVLVRHAEREPFIKGEPGSHKKLTIRGERAALTFGERIGGRRIKAYASPMFRCMRTAELILAGAKEPENVCANDFLGDPGAYVFDDELTRGFYVKNPTKTVALEYIRTGTLPGHYPIREGTDRLLGFLKSTAFQDGIAVCVTHDVFLCAFVSTLTEYDFTDDWTGFLDGCILFRKNEIWYLWWRGKETKL